MLKPLIILLMMSANQGHISMTSLEQAKGTDSLKVSCRMNFDDFLKDLQTIDDDRNLKRLFTRQPFPNDLINQYFNSKVFIYLNRKLLIGKLLSANLSEDDIILNLLFKSDKNPKNLTVRNLILTGWHTDQTNLMIIKINSLETELKLNPAHTEETFKIK